MDCSDDILKNTVSYLYQISEALPQNLSIPKSYYASKSRILELKGQVSLPTRLTTDKIRCPRCCLNFTEYPPNVRLKPKRPKDRFTKKLLRKIEGNKPLTNYQEKFKTILKKRTDKNILEKICQFCKKEIKTPVNFPKPQVEKPQIEQTPVITKKKKKKKDKFAGLTPSSVISINESIFNIENEAVKKTIKQIISDNNSKQKEEEERIKNNNNEKKKNKKKKKKAIEAQPVQSSKMKIMEKKESKADKKKKNQLKKLLNGNDKAVNVLNGFLQSL